jgi:hypothetical protein
MSTSIGLISISLGNELVTVYFSTYCRNKLPLKLLLKPKINIDPSLYYFNFFSKQRLSSIPAY